MTQTEARKSFHKKEGKLDGASQARHSERFCPVPSRRDLRKKGVSERKRELPLASRGLTGKEGGETQTTIFPQEVFEDGGKKVS